MLTSTLFSVSSMTGGFRRSLLIAANAVLRRFADVLVWRIGEFVEDPSAGLDADALSADSLAHRAARMVNGRPDRRRLLPRPAFLRR
jgi:hypothetical protein